MDHELSVMVFYLPPRGGQVPPGLVRSSAARRREADVESRGVISPAPPRPKGDPRPRRCLTWGRRRS